MRDMGYNMTFMQMKARKYDMRQKTLRDRHDIRRSTDGRNIIVDKGDYKSD